MEAERRDGRVEVGREGRGRRGGRRAAGVAVVRGVVAAVLLAAPVAAQDAAIEAARAYRAEHGPRIVREYAELLSLPNVASDDEGIRRNAAYIAELFRARGARMELLEVEGSPPLVVGELPAPGATRTVGIYVHYDGQPVARDRWTHAPWEPTLYTRSMEAGGEPRALPADGEAVDPEWRLYARSAGDDKAPFPALLAALDALEEAGIPRTSNLVFLFDGEEEAGSRHLPELIERYGDRMQADVWLFCDGPVHPSGTPQVALGVRGVTGLEVTVYGATRNLHSGHYGNWAPQPSQMLAALLTSMKDPFTGEVKVDGFYDTVEPVGPRERAALDALPPYDEELMRELGISWHEGPDAETLTDRLLRPSLTVRGLAAGSVGDEARNVIPNRATAALGIRLVAGNDPGHMLELVEEHIRGQGYHIVREEPDMETRLAHERIARVERGGGYAAARTPLDVPVVGTVIAAAREAARAGGPMGSGAELILLPTLGGTLPLFNFTEGLGAPAVIVPIANADNNQHAPDENVRVGNLWYGIDLYASLLTMGREAMD